MLKSLIWKIQDNITTIDKANYNSVYNDLKLNKILPLMSKEPNIKMTPDIFLKSLTNNMENILFRQCILENFVKNKKIVMELAELIVLIDRMQGLHKILKPEARVPAMMLRLKKLEIYKSIMMKLEKVFSANENSSANDDFSLLCQEIRKLNKANGISTLEKDIKKVKTIIGKTKSIDIGANIDEHDLREAIILSLNGFKYGKSDVIDKISCGDADEYERKSIASEIDISSAGQLLIFENELYRDLDSLLGKELSEIESLLNKYKNIITSGVLAYRDEICLYFGALKLREYLAFNDCETCLPTGSEATVLLGMYSINMLVERNSSEKKQRYKVVRNSVSLTNDEDVMLITGPNNGGKTILVESLGLIQLLYQNGMYIPASEGTLPIYNKIFTHFPKDEDITKGAGRLGEEAGRVRDILRNIKDRTLVILNEPYITTSPLEGRDILVNTIGKFRERGISMYLVTHYLDILNEMDSPDGIVSYVLEIDDGILTYIARKMLPMADSHAMDVARTHGVDFEGIMTLINDKAK